MRKNKITERSVRLSIKKRASPFSCFCFSFVSQLVFVVVVFVVVVVAVVVVRVNGIVKLSKVKLSKACTNHTHPPPLHSQIVALHNLLHILHHLTSCPSHLLYSIKMK